MRIKQLILTALLTCAALLPIARAAESTSIHAILIMASNEKAAADSRLQPYEAPLQRNLPESSFRYVGEGSASISGNGHSKISLGSGHVVDLNAEKTGGSIKLTVNWTNGGATIISGTFITQPGAPIVLGRRPSNGAVPVVLLIAK